MHASLLLMYIAIWFIRISSTYNFQEQNGLQFNALTKYVDPLTNLHKMHNCHMLVPLFITDLQWPYRSRHATIDVFYVTIDNTDVTIEDKQVTVPMRRLMIGE